MFENLEFARKLFKEETVQQFKDGVKTPESDALRYTIAYMNKFGDNKWWLETNDEIKFLKNMLFYNWICVPFAEFQKLTQKYLGHSVSHLGFVFERLEILKELELMYPNT